MTVALEVTDLHARLGDVSILEGVDITVPSGEMHVLMGPNGSGKSTLCHAVMGRPGYEVTGRTQVGGTDVLGLPVDERSRLGLFEAFQYPVEIGGITLRELLDEIELAGVEGAVERGLAAASTLDMDAFLDRRVNGNLSGGEKKRSEIVQLMAMAPRAAILDEIDSGLDVDAVREVAGAVEAMQNPDLGTLLITHYTRILRYLDVDGVHVMLGGRIVATGDRSLADHLDDAGYDGMRREFGIDDGDDAAGDPFP